MVAREVTNEEHRDEIGAKRSEASEASEAGKLSMRNASSLTIIGLSALLGIAKSGSKSVSDESLHTLKKYFAVNPDKNIPKSYIKHELQRLTVLPENLRTEQQKEIIKLLKSVG